MSEVKVVGSQWFSPSGAVIGIVLVKMSTGHKCYIGTGSGSNEASDAEYIARNGSRFRYGNDIWPHIKDWVQD